ncbi:hypothetical protein [Acidaminobacterium chupaoyuni]
MMKNEKPKVHPAPIPAETKITHAGMRRDRIRAKSRGPMPDESSVIDEMHWVMENQK